jgi:hypothetical protein
MCNAARVSCTDFHTRGRFVNPHETYVFICNILINNSLNMARGSKIKKKTMRESDVAFKRKVCFVFGVS